MKLYPCFEHWLKYQNIWVIADLHLGDPGIEEYFGGRPAEEIISKLKQYVHKKDLLICLGDLGCEYQHLGEINAGRKVLIAGNHDYPCLTKYQREIKRYKCKTKEEAFLKKERKLNLNSILHASIEQQFDVLHEPFEYWELKTDNKLFDEIYSSMLTIASKLVLSHEGIDIPWAFVLHGHHHEKDWEDTEQRLNLCGEKIDYTPLNLKQWIKNGGLSKVPNIHELTKEKRNGR